MIVITLTDCPPSLRGDLTKWLQEVNTGVYVGQVSARVRDEVWKRVLENVKSGKATMVFSAKNEQHMDFRVHNTSWEPIDFDGLKLMMRPSPERAKKLGELRMGFSRAAQMRKARQISKHKHKSSPEKYLILDVETTGLSAKKHEIIEISALKIEEREIKAEFHAFVKAKAPVPPSITELTGISNEMLEREGREITDVLPGFLEFAGNLPVVSHNADFDFGFLRSACERCSLPLFSNKYVDTLTLARRLIDDVKNYKLTTLLDYFGIEKNCVHRSTDDCLNTKQLYEKLIELQQEEK